MAEKIFENVVKNDRIDGIICSSAGLATINGLAASENAVTVCKKIGINLESHLSKNILDVPLNDVDIFFVMTKSHMDALIKHGVEKEKIYLPSSNISDPFGQDVSAYKVCRDQIKDEVTKFWDSIKKKLN